MFFVLYCRRLSLLLKCARGEFYLFALDIIKSDHHNMLHGRMVSKRRIYVLRRLVDVVVVGSVRGVRVRERGKRKKTKLMWAHYIECCNNFSSERRKS